MKYLYPKFQWNIHICSRDNEQKLNYDKRKEKDNATVYFMAGA